MKFLLLFLTLSAFAHESHDWRMDYEGFLSIHSPDFTNVNSPAPKRVDMSFFREKLTVIASVERKSTKNLDVTRAFLEREYAQLGFKVSYQPFASGKNFIAEKKGTTHPEKVLVLSSHIDSVGNKGANDNGTGTAGVLAIAKELAKKEFPITIRVLGFDREEEGLLGSDAYVATIPDSEEIVGNINFEMMGFNSRKDGAFHVIDCGRKDSLFLSSGIRNAISDLGLSLSIVKACTDRSDHASFWRNNLPAVVISENFFGGDGDPCYHARCDVLDDRLDYGYMGNILEAVLGAVEKILRN